MKEVILKEAKKPLCRKAGFCKEQTISRGLCGKPKTMTGCPYAEYDHGVGRRAWKHICPEHGAFTTSKYDLPKCPVCNGPAMHFRTYQYEVRHNWSFALTW